MNGFKSVFKKGGKREHPRNLKFFRHLDPQEKVRGEGTHFKVPWATWKPRRLGRDIWKGETFHGGSPGVAGTSGFRNHNPLWIRYEFLVNPRWIRYESHVGADFFLFSRHLFWWRKQSSAGLIVMILWSWKIPEWSTRESFGRSFHQWTPLYLVNQTNQDLEQHYDSLFESSSGNSEHIWKNTFWGSP